jgi:hypothetical protein
MTKNNLTQLDLTFIKILKLDFSLLDLEKKTKLELDLTFAKTYSKT